MRGSRSSFIIVLMILLLFLGLCGCTKKAPDGTDAPDITDPGTEQREPDTTVPEWEQNADGPLILDWYVNVSWFTTGWGQNMVSKKITEETGVSVNFITPMGSETNKLDTLISSNSLPDLITIGWWENQVDIMIEDKMVYPLNELADEYDPYFWKVTDSKAIEWYTKKDGNVYGYPNTSYVPEDYETHDNIGSNQTFLVRKDIYEAIGSPDMTTPQGFKNAVMKAARMFPKVGKKPLIPIGAHVFTEAGCVSFDQYLQNFLAVPYEKNGRRYDRYTDKEYITWLKMFRELGATGYLKEDIFIDQRKQMEEKLEEGRYFCMLYQRTDLADQQKILYAKNPDMIYIAVDGPKNSMGQDYELPGAGINGWMLTFISKNCERPDRAIQFLSYLISEQGQKMTFLGVEGSMYHMEGEKPVIDPEVEELSNTNREEYDRLYGADNTYWMLQDTAMQLAWKPELEGPMKEPEEWTFPYTKYMGQYETDFVLGTEAGNADTNIKQLWSKTLPRLLLAHSETEFDEIMREFVQEREKLGFQALEEESTRQMKETKSRLGME